MDEKIKALIDTELLMDYISGTGSSAELEKIIHLFEKGAVDLGISVLSAAELGVLIKEEVKRNTILGYLRACEIKKVPVCLETAVMASSLQSKYGMNMSEALQITTAIKNDYDLFLSRNSWLKRVSEIRVIDPKSFLELTGKEG